MASQTSSSFFKNNWLILRPKLSNAFREPHCLSLSVVFTRWTDSANTGAGQPGLYGISRAVWGFTDWLWTNQISSDPVCISWSCNNTFYRWLWYCLELYLLVRKHIYCVGQIDRLLHLHFATPYQWVVWNSVSAWKYVLQFGLWPFPSKMIELKALPFPV